MTEPAATLRDRIAAAIRDAACPGNCGKTEEECAKERIQPFVWHHGRLAVVEGAPEMFADAVLAVLPPPADWAAELAKHVTRAIFALKSPAPRGSEHYRSGWDDGLEAAMDAARDELLRRLAAEAQPTTKPEHQPRRGDEFEAWLKAQRDEYGTRSSREWRALDEVLDTYRLHADTGTPLGEHVCEGNGCEHQEPAAGARQDETWTVKESTRRYAEELRSTTRTASADGHTDWECDAGAQLLVAAETPRPGRVATHHGTIYACARHRAAAVERITGAGYEADPQPAPPGHRWNPWPCGHVTAHGTGALTGLTGVRQDGAQSP